MQPSDIVMPWRDPVIAGQESVWDHPRPAIAEPCSSTLQIVHHGITVAATQRAVRTLETSHPPTYYFPPDDVDMLLLHPAAGGSFCEWKGQARYFDVIVAGERIAGVAWTYRDPTPGFASLRDYIAFYAAPFDTCTVDGERVTPQPGGFYGGWITRALAGPFKGIPGSRFW